MRCPACNGESSKVYKSRRGVVNGDDVVIRDRRCLRGDCRFAWRSYECYEPPTGERTEEKLSRIREIVLDRYR